MKRTSVFRLSLAITLAAAVHARAETFTAFESGHVRPLALVPSADLLIAVNEPAARISIFEVTAVGLSLAAEVPVGLEPVAVATRTLSSGRVEAWVVNHLSDSVSIVEIDPSDVTAAHVKRTLLVGDEPRDIVFAGPSGSRAFITTAHRGQHRPGDPQAFVPGVGRADVWVFDADAPGDLLGGTPITIVTLFGDTPRALATSPDGQTVHAAVFRSGNGTSSINAAAVTSNGGLPPPPTGATPNAPATGLIVKKDASTGAWKDELERDWSAQVPFGLPDLDVFEIDAMAAVPVESGAVAGVGTVLLAMATRPGTGTLYVGNLEARNEIRFEPVLRGDIGQNRITIVGGNVATPVHLNPHIDYETIPGAPGEVEESLAFPTGLAFSSDGRTLFVAALGSNKIFALDADQLEAGNPSPRAQLLVGGGPTGLVLDDARDRLYVMNRVDHTIAIVANASSPARSLAGAVTVGWDPTPPVINAGRRFLYDARRTSAHGDAACASCHVFADTDDLAWDLGDPFAPTLVIANQPAMGGINRRQVRYHPLKGPMLTQSLRGLRHAGPLHWRGDRSAAASGGDPFDVVANVETFNGTFPALLGVAPLAPSDMRAFAEFVAALRYPPNPYRSLDDAPTPEQAAGEQIFRTRTIDVESLGSGRGCATCHAFPRGTEGAILPEFGSELKVPHLRNAYQKVGRFGAVANDHAVPPYVVGDQVRGFGLEFDGSLGSLVDFNSAFVPSGFSSAERVPVAEFVLAFDTGQKPIVGTQVTVGPASVGDSSVSARIALLIARDDAGDCDLVAHGRVGGTRAAWRHESAGRFAGGTAGSAATTTQLLEIAAVAGQEITFTCAPQRNGRRFGNDADEDLVLNDDEIVAGSDPYDAASVPSSFAVAPVATQRFVFTDRTTPRRGPADPAKRKLVFVSSTRNSPPANRIVAPAPGGVGDPRLHGARLFLYNAAFSEEAVEIELPASGWTAKGSPSRPKGFLYKSLAADGPVRQVLVVKDKIAITAGKARLEYSLDERAQRRIALRLVLGNGAQWCTGAIAGKIDQADKFVGVATPPPAECIPF